MCLTAQFIKSFHFKYVLNIPDILSYSSFKRSAFTEIMGFSWYSTTIAEDVLKNKNVQHLLQNQEEHFDLIILETLQTDALLGFADHYNAAVIGVSSFGTDPYIDSLVDNISPMAYTPLHTGTFTERMTFPQRLENMWQYGLMFLHRVLMQQPLHEQMHRKYFPNNKRSLQELRQNISLILINQHFSLSYPRSYVTNMIEVGGFHIQHTPQSLPLEIENFINSSQQDVIYFSMGSNIKSEHFPAAIRNLFLETFSSLPFKILWKFENPSLMTNRPTNVFISKWFPQPDILAHPRVKLFITHGGLLSIIESIYHSKPILGIPVFYDQFINVLRAQQAGFGLALEYQKLNGTVLRDSISKLMTNSTYAEKAKEMSQRYRDQPIDPMEKAIYWTEYVLRHRGAGFLRSPAQYLNVWQRNSLDCIAVFMVCFIFIVVVFIVIISKCLTCCCRSRSTQKVKIN